ncbi:MAG TPA: chemotaxis protein CheA [Burkholderiales bacterium]|nr:chemotaxis protein CheA [Burkholderiales bacterium]
MNAFTDMQDLLLEFLSEAGELLDDVDLQLVELEGRADDLDLLNAVFRGFHTIKGGAGFLEATALVTICHRAEALLDRLRSGKLRLTPDVLDYILAATGEVRRMFGEMANLVQPDPAPEQLIAQLEALAQGESLPEAPAPAAAEVSATVASNADAVPAVAGEPDWAALYAAVSGKAVAAQPAAAAKETKPVEAPAPKAPAPKGNGAQKNGGAAKGGGAQKENTLRIDTQRFDQILNLSGEIGLTKNRLACIRRDLLRVGGEMETLKALDDAVNELDMLVSDLQNSVMKARMQPVGRVFQKYVRLTRDLARQLGKEIELVLVGEDTEVDKTILEELNDPLVHLVRNAVDHGVEMPAERVAQGKPAKSIVRLAARQTGDQIIIEIADDGKGMRPEVIRAKAVEKGVISPEEAVQLDDRQSLQLIFAAGFSTKEQASNLSGRGVGMDVVKTNIHRLKGRIDLESVPGKGTTVSIVLPLTLAILPVLNLRLGMQPFAVPLAAVREIIELSDEVIEYVSGKPHILMRGEVLPFVELSHLLNRPRDGLAPLGVVATVGDRTMVLGVDGLMGQDEVMIKPLAGVKPRGVAGATISGEGSLVLVLELHELLDGVR